MQYEALAESKPKPVSAEHDLMPHPSSLSYIVVLREKAPCRQRRSNWILRLILNFSLRASTSATGQ